MKIKTLFFIMLVGAFSVEAQVMASTRVVNRKHFSTEVDLPSPANVNLTNAELTELRASTAFRNYLLEKIIAELGYYLGQNSGLTSQTALWHALAKRHEVKPFEIVDDGDIVNFAIIRMIPAGLAKKNDAIVGTLTDQVIAYLEANAPNTIIQAYLDSKAQELIHRN